MEVDARRDGVAPAAPARATRVAAPTAMALVLFAVAYGTNVPSPLLLRYRVELGLSPTALTGIFGVYAAGLLPALLLAGPASDRHGRRPVVLPFVALAAAASVLFIPAVGSVPLLFLARFLQGAVSGVVFSVGSAWLAELSVDGAAAAARRATVALSAGWALGPLSAGVLGQFSPWPTTLPYLVHLALVGVGGLLAWRLPETHPGREGGPLLDLGVPPGAGRAFGWWVAPAAVCVFALPSVSITVLPLLLREAMAGYEVLVTGVVAALTMSTGVLGQRLARRLPPLRAAPLGAAFGAAGLATGCIASATQATILLLPAALLLGAGYALALVSGLTVTERLAAPEARGALTSSFYACAYLGFGVPVLMSLAAGGGSLAPPLAVLSGIGLLIALLLVAGPGRSAVARAAG